VECVSEPLTCCPSGLGTQIELTFDGVVYCDCATYHSGVAYFEVFAPLPLDSLGALTLTWDGAKWTTTVVGVVFVHESLSTDCTTAVDHDGDLIVDVTCVDGTYTVLAYLSNVHPAIDGWLVFEGTDNTVGAIVNNTLECNVGMALANYGTATIGCI